MSADNSIAILYSKDEIRVAHCQALENINYWHVENAPIYQFELRKELNPYILFNYFNSSPIFKIEEDAFKYAQQLYNEIGYVEYGICKIIYDKEFPKECPSCCENQIIVSIEDNKQCQNCGEYLSD